MSLHLKKASSEDLEDIYQLQLLCFEDLLRRYQDHQHSPGAEAFERTRQRFYQPETTYFKILMQDCLIGAIRVYFSQEEQSCWIAPMFILPELQNQGLGYQAMVQVEGFYPQVGFWKLDTILQETKLCQFYEKLGFKDTGKRANLKEGMDLIFYERHR